MTDRDRGTPGCDEAGAFERLLTPPAAPRPPGDLLALTAEFRPFDAARASFRLDDFAR